MALRWAIEAGVYGAEATPLLEEIRHRGMPIDLISHRSLVKGEPIPGGPAPRDEAGVIACGTYPFARQVQLHTRWRPGAWCDLENFRCTAYYSYFGEYLLNSSYAIMAGVEAVRQRDWLFSTFGRGGRVFARPADCQKLFVGRCIALDDFRDALAPARYDPTALVVVSSPKEIGREWRFVVAGDRVVAASRYADSGRRDVARGCPGEVREHAERILSEVSWRPDPIFMMDLCESEDGLRLVELNGFSCSWIYECDPVAVVDAVVALAEGADNPRHPEILPKQNWCAKRRRFAL